MSDIDDKAHRAFLIREVVKREVCFPRKDQFYLPHYIEIKEWLLEHVGEQRPHHPYNEARDGWMDYFEGDWASEVRTSAYQSDGGCEINYWCFWIHNETARVHFRLRFGGTMGSDIKW